MNELTPVLNKELRATIIQMIHRAGEGHIPSSFSILDAIHFLYTEILKYDPKKPKWEERDYFVLSKGHGCAALYVVLNKYGFLKGQDLIDYGKPGAILGGHPDVTCVPGAEASTGSLGHGFPTAMGLALGLRIKNRPNRVFALLGDGECHEGTVWESANVANNLELGNLCALVDWNGSAAQLMSKDDLPGKWKSFGWEVQVVNGHSDQELRAAFSRLTYAPRGTPKVIICQNVKGWGVKQVQGHGIWHHKIPNEQEMAAMLEELK